MREKQDYKIVLYFKKNKKLSLHNKFDFLRKNIKMYKAK